MLLWLMNLGFAGGDGEVTPPDTKTRPYIGQRTGRAARRAERRRRKQRIKELELLAQAEREDEEILQMIQEIVAAMETG